MREGGVEGGPEPRVTEGEAGVLERRGAHVGVGQEQSLGRAATHRGAQERCGHGEPVRPVEPVRDLSTELVEGGSRGGGEVDGAGEASFKYVEDGADLVLTGDPGKDLVARAERPGEACEGEGDEGAQERVLVQQ